MTIDDFKKAISTADDGVKMSVASQLEKKVSEVRLLKEMSGTFNIASSAVYVNSIGFMYQMRSMFPAISADLCERLSYEMTKVIDEYYDELEMKRDYFEKMLTNLDEEEKA